MRFLIFGLLALSSNLFALDKKVLDSSEKVTVNSNMSEFAKQYMAAINSKSTQAYVDLMSPLSQKCYKESKHPEYYQQELKKWFKSEIKSLKEIRKYKTVDHQFYQLMNYPEDPTHVAVFDSEEIDGGRKYTGWQSIELIEKDGRYFISYRCM